MSTPLTHPAIVCRTNEADHVDRYLVLRADGVLAWTDDVEAATPFETLREATRTALRLPSALKAYGLPRPHTAVTLH